MTEVADKLAWSQSTISRLETGVRAASIEEVSALLAVYRITGARRDALLEMARDVDRPSWLETCRDGVPCQVKTLAQYEKEATRIIESGSAMVPALLQTPSYMRAALVAIGVPAEEIEARLERQKVLEWKKLVAYLDEGALRRQIGGTRIMANQVRHLVSMAQRPSVELRVFPFEAGGHPGMSGAYVLLELADRSPVVRLEHQRSGVFLHRAVDVEPYARSTVLSNAVALDPARSKRLIESLVPPA
ncbi:helix-turn-helix transcriptional regulator [Amycolatopsis umgeniensis]|uniref:Transcriptional regulator with XRE-family HTH domain n=1 Tax=Amycolatopsis umgeniensis TaxID=336628 RepID=A0A841B7X1_9PSEU|nr:Scr1 family TA system antitoxin-like transcriptional regulator [Amycolatopsis umgeniensis]MBB5854672.1 transcriptional regulator with XRE-family HTH domain [Amycolatopsis umgeniensis]